MEAKVLGTHGLLLGSEAASSLCAHSDPLCCCCVRSDLAPRPTSPPFYFPSCAPPCPGCRSSSLCPHWSVHQGENRGPSAPGLPGLPPGPGTLPPAHSVSLPFLPVPARPPWSSATHKLEDEEQVGEGGEDRGTPGQAAAARSRSGGHAGARVSASESEARVSGSALTEHLLREPGAPARVEAGISGPRKEEPQAAAGGALPPP